MPGAKTAGVVGNTQDKLAAFRSHASDDVVRKIREATKLLEQKQAAAAAAPEPPAEEDHPSYMEDAAKEVKALPEAHAPAPPAPQEERYPDVDAELLGEEIRRERTQIDGFDARATAVCDLLAEAERKLMEAERMEAALLADDGDE